MNANLKHKKEQLAKGQRIAFISTLLVFALALVKAIVGYLCHSPLLIADAWHSGADILINASSLIGLKFARQKKSNRFPYGLYRAETLASLLIGGLILFFGVDLFQEGRHRLLLLDPGVQFPIVPVMVAALSCGVSLFLAVKQKAVGTAIGSMALLATAREAFFDIFTSLFVLAGMVFVYVRVPYVEGSVIILISILILKLGLETAWKAVMILMDANLDEELKNKIEASLYEISGVNGVEDVAVRQSGPFKMVTCKIKTSPSLQLYQSHGLADIAEHMLLNKYQSIESVFVHVEPETKQIQYAVIPVLTRQGLDSVIAEQFGKAPYFARLILNRDDIQIESYMKNQHTGKKGHIGLNVVKAMLADPVHLLFVSSIGEISFHMLKNNCVHVLRVEKKMTVAEIICAYKDKKLTPITRPNKSKKNF